MDPSAWLFDFSLLSCLGTMPQWIFKCILFFFLEPHFIRIYNVLSTLDWKPSLTWCAPLLWSLLVFGIHFLSTVKKEDDLKRKDKRHLYKHFKSKWKPKQVHRTRTRFTRTIRVNETFISARERAIIHQTVKNCLHQLRGEPDTNQDIYNSLQRGVQIRRSRRARNRSPPARARVNRRVRSSTFNRQSHPVGGPNPPPVHPTSVFSFVARISNRFLGRRVVWDSGASCSISNDRTDFVGPIRRPSVLTTVKGITRGLRVAGEGTIHWKFKTESGHFRIIKLQG